jgi:hypothetical protein
MTTHTTVYVFAGAFPSRDDACLYTQEQWELEPGEDVSDDEYAAWEDSNPSWKMAEDLDLYLDPDFVETIDGDDRYAYLQDLLVNKDAISTVQQRAPSDANILVLIFKPALGGFAAEMKSIGNLVFCGEYPCTM